MKPPAGGPHLLQPDEVATYISRLTRDLALMARQNGLAALGYVLEMARLEAESAKQQLDSDR